MTTALHHQAEIRIWHIPAWQPKAESRSSQSWTAPSPLRSMGRLEFIGNPSGNSAAPAQHFHKRERGGAEENLRRPLIS